MKKTTTLILITGLLFATATLSAKGRSGENYIRGGQQGQQGQGNMQGGMRGQQAGQGNKNIENTQE